MTQIYVDADACPVKDEVVRVAGRHGVKTLMVCDGGLRPYADPLVELVIVAEGMDAADNWIAERIGPDDVAVTNDIPLAARCVKAGAAVLRPNGQAFDERTIGLALAKRDLMTELRDTGQIAGGGPPPFSRQDRSNFLSALEVAVRAKLG